MSDSGLASHTGLTPAGSHVLVAQYGNDTGLHAEFYSEAVYQAYESEQQGRPVYKDVNFIYITRPCARSDLRREVRMVTDGTIPTDPERFPRQWQAFQNKQEQVQSGMPLEQWAPLTKATVLELKAAKVHTVEQLAALPDSTLQNLGMMDARRFRDMAKAQVDRAGEGAEVSKLSAENQQLKADMAVLRQQFAAFSERSVDDHDAETIEPTIQKRKYTRRAQKEEENADQV